MKLLDTLIGLAWIVFIIVWVVSMFFAKRTVSRSRRAVLIRIAIIVVVILIMRGRRLAVAAPVLPTGNYTLGLVGLGLCVAGIAVAFWARFFIGRNWGMPMTRKAEPELVTGGPYRYVRHPIYSGILLAMLGTALAMGLPWFILLALMLVYFIWSARTEERYLMTQFPDAYPAYRVRTRMLVPFVL